MLALPALMLSSCLSVDLTGLMLPIASETGLRTVSFRTDVTDSQPTLKSILPEEQIEDLVTDITLASYDANGILTDTGYYTDNFNAMELFVDTSRPADIYAVVNMGDMSTVFPPLEKDLQGMEYILGSYDELVTSGLPMSGVLSELPVDAVSGTVPVERLFAKVRVRILHTGLANPYGYTGFVYNMCNKSLYMRQANSVLKPFCTDGSRAEAAEDIMSLSDYNADMNDRMAYEGSLDQFQLGPGPGYCMDTTFVFYVPENVQGRLLPDNTDPFGKDEYSISDIDGNDYSGLCTYIEFNARRELTQGYSGDLTYKYYLGSDNITDFSVERNRVYDMHLNFSEEGLFVDSWKVTRGDDWVDNRLLCFRKSAYYICPGESTSVVIHYHRDGILDDDSTFYPDDWELSYAENLATTYGLTCSLDKESLHTGEDGYADFVMTVTASDDAYIGGFVPVVIRTFEGSIVDRVIVNIKTPWELIE